jgi:hypothetical protein
MWASWSIISILQITTARYMKNYWHFNMWLHRLGAVFILTATLFYGIYGALKIGKVFDDVHGPLGLIITSVVGLLVLSGLLTRYSL